MVLKTISLSTFVICVKNMKHPSSVIAMKRLQNIHTSIQIYNYNLLSLSCWLRGKSSLPLLNQKEKVVKVVLKKCRLKNCGSKVVGSRHFYLSEYLWNNWYTMVLTGERIKPPKYINLHTKTAF